MTVVPESKLRSGRQATMRSIVQHADPFVRVGDEVEAGQTLGLVEAMKLMNPIVAEEPGVVTEIRVENAGSVEYDQVLMLLRRLP